MKKITNNFGIRMIDSVGEGIDIAITSVTVGLLAETLVSRVTDDVRLKALAYFGSTALIAIPRLITRLNEKFTVDEIEELKAKIAELEAKLNE